MARHLESAEELTAALSVRSTAEALVWFADWLSRRDSAQAELTADDLATALETLAAELRGEARTISNSRTAGLRLAAGYLTDSAHDVRQRGPGSR
jgi:hypothetical protein